MIMWLTPAVLRSAPRRRPASTGTTTTASALASAVTATLFLPFILYLALSSLPPSEALLTAAPGGVGRLGPPAAAFRCRSSSRILPRTLPPPPSSIRSKPVPLRSSGGDDGDGEGGTQASLPTLRLYNSLSRVKEPLVPQLPPLVSLYTCGPTVYDYAHVGNFRAFLTYDVLKRALTYLGYDVDHICNLTDVDDKIIARCKREGLTLKELTSRFEGLFMEDLDALNIVRARAYPRATDHIDDMVRLVQDLERAGLAYKGEGTGSWYFNVEEKEGYGTRLVDLDVKSMKRKGRAGRAGSFPNGDVDVDSGPPEDEEADEYDADKGGGRDFALWKAYKPDLDIPDAVWETPLGKGRPGWHLECSAMARSYLGPTIDLHAGGIDLKFPHHENEIAQSEGANGGAPFCGCWLHNGFVNIGSKDEKMSKSKGNFLTLKGACPSPGDVRAYRYLAVSSHYRNPLSFTDTAMDGARGALRRMDRAMERIDEALLSNDGREEEEEEEEEDTPIRGAIEREMKNFESAIADDLSMPRAAASLFGLIKAAEAELKRAAKANAQADGDGEADGSPPLDLRGLSMIREALKDMDRVFGIFYEVPPAFFAEEGGAGNTDKEEGAAGEEGGAGGGVPEEVMSLVAERSAAKEGGDYSLADSLRDQIEKLGYKLKDVKGGAPLVSRV